MSKSTNKIKNAIISYLSSLKTSNVHPDLKFYLDFYKPSFFIQTYSLVSQFLILIPNFISPLFMPVRIYIV